MYLLLCNKTVLQKLRVAHFVKKHITPYAVVTALLLGRAGNLHVASRHCVHVYICRHV